MNISKSNFVLGCQCEKALWLNKYKPELKEVSEETQEVFEIGTSVGEVARGLYPGGTLVEFDVNTASMAEKTKKLLANGTNVIYEAAFFCDNLIVICDILVRTKKGFEVYEVKSSTGIKDTYYIDTAFQYYVLKKAGLKVEKIHLVHINNQYIRKGELSLHDLFITIDVTPEAKQNIKFIESKLDHFWSVLRNSTEPNKDIGMYCMSPYECFFMNYCWRHIPENSVFDLSGVTGKKMFEMYSAGLLTFEQIEESGCRLSDSNAKQVSAALYGKKYIDPQRIREFLRSLSYPLYFLDFETYMQAVPMADGIRPYEQVPFQYSLHYMLEEDGELYHKDFLGKEGTNTKRELAEQLVRDIPKDTCVLAYNASFEKTVIRGLASAFPDLSVRLISIHNALLDLMAPFQKKHYYTKEMGGSHSLKSVLPALFQDDRELDYGLLEIQNGSMAMDAFAYLHLREPDEIQKIREALRAYCTLDTLAMVKLLEKLKSVSAG